MAESKGLWVDKDTGKVVSKQPVRGRQLVAPGQDVSQAEVDAIVARYTAQDAAPTAVESAAAPDVEQAADTSKPSRKTSK